MTKDELGELIDKSNAYYSICSLIDNNRGRKVIIRPSGVQTFLANRLAWATAQLLGLFFDGNDSTHTGTALHIAADHFYQNKIQGKVATFKECMLVSARVIRYICKANERYSIYCEAKRLFVQYFEHALLQNPLYSEMPCGIELDEWLEVKGTLDRIEVDEYGEHIVVDIKTSASNVYGTKVEEPTELVELKSQKTLFEKNIKEQFKSLNSEKRLKKTSDERKVEIEKEIQKLENELELQLSLFNEKIKPLEDEVAHQQYLNDCIAAKAKYGFQLAIYAMLYQIETGVEIHKARIELLVKTKEPKLRVFEFELDDLKVKVDAILLHIKEVLEYWNNGVPASVLFGFNPESFRGSELKEFLDF